MLHRSVILYSLVSSNRQRGRAINPQKSGPGPPSERNDVGLPVNLIWVMRKPLFGKILISGPNTGIG
jgi:hypothetical protein